MERPPAHRSERPRPPLRRAIHRATALLLGGLLLGGLASCGVESAREARAARPNVVFVTLDTTRADHLSLYGYDRVTDPFLVELARDALVFEQAVSPATWTLPSHASMFTGLDPVEHGARHRDDPPPDCEAGAPGNADFPALSDELPLFTTRLEEAGYHLIGAVSGRFTARRFGFARGFAEYLEPTATAQIPGAELNEFVFDALERAPEGRPLCLFVNYLDAHAPYAPPADRDYPFPAGDPDLPPHPGFEAGATLEDHTAEEIRRARDLYDRELLVQDEALGELVLGLGQRGLLEDALVVVTSDHGEAFGEHGLLAHGQPPFEPLVHVPLVVQRTVDGESVARGRVEEPVSLSNVAETVLANAGLPSLPGNERRFDLLDVPHDPPPAYVEFRGEGEWVGLLRIDSLKYLRVLEAPFLSETEYLYDLATDPGERRILVPGDQPRPRVERARDLFEALREDWRPEPSDVEYPPLSAADREALRALGYL